MAFAVVHITDVLGALAALLVALAGGAFGYAGLRRTRSGSVKTADAEVVFSAAEQLRKELRDEVVVLRGQLSAAQEKMALAERDAVTARERAERQEKKLDQMAGVLKDVSAQHLQCLERTDQLEAEIGSLRGGRRQADPPAKRTRRAP